MRRFLLVFLFILGCLSVFAQNSNITVDFLTELTNDTEGSVARRLDNRDKKCALIKVRTPNLNAEERAKFSFQADAGTEVFLEKAKGELKVFLTEGVKKLRIIHDDYGVKEYNIPIQIVGFKTYLMEITVDKEAIAQNIAPKNILSANYVKINVEPDDAVIMIDDRPVREGVAYLELDEDHMLTVSKAMYHTHTQIIRSNKNKKEEFFVKLIPAFGWLKIESQPENGATVFVDGVEKGQTPYKSDRLESGEHTVKLIMEMFEPLEKTVMVRDNDTSAVTLKMKADFAEVTINVTDIKANIFVDGKQLSTGSWKGRLNKGKHLIEAKRDYHKPTMKEISCTVGQPLTVSIDSPIPIIGNINIISTPLDAKIFLDGKDTQKVTPDIVQDVYAGEHNLRIVKEGYSVYDETIIVKENEMTNIEVTLASMKDVTISSDNAGDIIYIDGEYAGVSPLNTKVKYGEIVIEAEHDGIKQATNVIVTDDMNSNIRVHVGTSVTIKTTNSSDKIFVDGKLVNSQEVKLSMGFHEIRTVRGGIIRNRKVRILDNKPVKINMNTHPRKNTVNLEFSFLPLYYLCGGVTYEWKFYPHIKNFSAAFSFKTGLLVDFREIVYEFKSYSSKYRKWYDEEQYGWYRFFDIPFLLKMDLGNHRYAMWAEMGLMYAAGISTSSLNGDIGYYAITDAPYYNESDMQAVSGMNFQLGLGCNLRAFMLGVKYIEPISNYKSFCGTSFKAFFITIGVRMGRGTANDY